MDGLSFYWPHNQGFFSLTYGPDRFTILGKSADAWHSLKVLLLLYIAVEKVGLNWRLIVAAGIFMATQLIIYNWLIKLT